jgi:hypothetical protein
MVAASKPRGNPGNTNGTPCSNIIGTVLAVRTPPSGHRAPLVLDALLATNINCASGTSLLALWYSDMRQ